MNMNSTALPKGLYPVKVAIKKQTPSTPAKKPAKAPKTMMPEQVMKPSMQ